MKGPNPLIMLMCLSILFMLNNAKRNDKKVSESLRANNMEYIDDDYVSISQVKLPKPLVTCPLFVDDLPYAEDLGYYEYTVGSITYLVDSQRRIISGGYFDHYKKNNIVYGKTAVSSEVVIDSNGNINNMGGSNRYRQEDIDKLESVVKFLSDDYTINQSAAVMYIVKNGMRVTNDYHEFYIENNGLYGRIGATIERIDL